MALQGQHKQADIARTMDQLDRRQKSVLEPTYKIIVYS